MSDHERVREYIHGMIGHRTRISEAEREILYKLLDTPSVHARFPALTLEDLCTIADSLVEQILQTPPRKGRRRRPA